MPLGPTVRRRRLGTELRRLREACSLTLEEAAARLELAPSTLSRIETGKAPTRAAYLVAMLDMYDVTDPAQRQVLTEMARDGHRRGWWAAYEDVLPTGFGIYVGLESEAATLRAFEDQVVHGLLQTEEYARTVMTAVRRHLTPGDVDRTVRLRLQRQQVLSREEPLDLQLILDEAVIRRPVGGLEVMRRQLSHLLAVSQRPNVSIQVLPFAIGAHPALNGPFCILSFPARSDPDVVYAEGVAGPAYLEKGAAVSTCAETFSLLRAAALTPAATGELIRAAAAELTASSARPLAEEEDRRT